MERELSFNFDASTEDFLYILDQIFEDLNIEYQFDGEGTITYKIPNN